MNAPLNRDRTNIVKRPELVRTPDASQKQTIRFTHLFGERKFRIVLCTGGRDFKKRAVVEEVLDEITLRHSGSPFILIQGGAAGLDHLVRSWSVEQAIPCLNSPADWGAHGMSAGGRRNSQMLRDMELLGCPVELCLSFPGGTGTADMTVKARIAGVPTLLLEDYVDPVSRRLAVRTAAFHNVVPIRQTTHMAPIHD